MINVTLTLPVTDKLARYFLTSCYEGGSAYWLACDSVVYTGHDTDDYGVSKIVGCFESDVEELDAEKWGDADLDTIRTGMQKILDGTCAVRADIRGDILAALLDDDDSQWDAETADCVLQAGLLGEITYG